MATVVERSKISPQAGGAPESVPLVFFDLLWYGFAADQSVLFFDFPCSKSEFLDKVVPHLKTSLSITLTHFFPLAGNIIHPLNPQDKPVLRYESTDSVPFTVCESDADLGHLTGNQPRNCDEFYALAPLLPRAARSDASVSCPVLALQVTLFPGKGLSIGFVTHHTVADACSVASFIRAWALVNGIGPDGDDIRARLTEGNVLPSFDREAAANLNGLDSLYWDVIVKESWPVEPPPPLTPPVNKLRATVVLNRNEIEKLKDSVRAASVAHVSSFTVACALVWACSAKSGEEEAAEYFCFTVDCRRRLKLPSNYFGNCVAMSKAELKKHGADGFLAAAVTIGAAVEGIAKTEKGVLDGAENWPAEYTDLAGKRVLGVAGSPRFDFYEADFGWGKPKKFEALFLDAAASISLCKSRDFEGGLEIGFSKPNLQMDAFLKAYNQLLLDLLN